MEQEFQETHSPKRKRHDHRRNLLPDVAANRQSFAVRSRAFCLQPIGVNLLVHGVWDHTVILPVINLHFSFLHLCNVPNKHTHRNDAATVHLQSSSSSISHPFTPESEPGLKYTEDMVRLPFSSVRCERGLSVSRVKSTPLLQKVNRWEKRSSVLRRYFFTLSTKCEGKKNLEKK